MEDLASILTSQRPILIGTTLRKKVDGVVLRSTVALREAFLGQEERLAKILTIQDSSLLVGKVVKKKRVRNVAAGQGA